MIRTSTVLSLREIAHPHHGLERQACGGRQPAFPCRRFRRRRRRVRDKDGHTNSPDRARLSRLGGAAAVTGGVADRRAGAADLVFFLAQPAIKAAQATSNNNLRAREPFIDSVNHTNPGRNQRVRLAFASPQRVAHQLQPRVSRRGENRFRMELNRFDRQFAMPNAHDDAVVRFRGDFETSRHALRNRVERVVAADLDLLRQALENAECRDAAPSRVCRASGYGSTPSSPPNASTIPCSPRHTPNTGMPALRRVLHQLRHAEILGPARARRDQDHVRLHRVQNFERGTRRDT